MFYHENFLFRVYEYVKWELSSNWTGGQKGGEGRLLVHWVMDIECFHNWTIKVLEDTIDMTHEVFFFVIFFYIGVLNEITN